MNLFAWADSKIKNFRWYDISLTKISMLGFSLMLAKLWPAILTPAWWVWGIVFIVPVFVVMPKMFK
ncbi:hypothetical protein GOV11_03560 [Candidatus Woesearchaeota archaeon]|nr:hypothetical protein [Candidatus Woesearchaeota archaeon]